MIHLEIGGERYPIAAGETVIGSASDSAVVLSGEGVHPRHAVVQGASSRSAAIRVAIPQAEVRVNGVRLGAEPTPLLHGDKIAIGSHELRVVDTDRAGSTQLFDSGAFADLAPPRSAKPPAGRSGGRLVCLTDGREYKIGDRPLTLGRDAAADVVVTGHEVSRNHAEIRPDAEGYTLIDSSVNGTYVNGARVQKTHRLARADVIRIGNDEFRFYADATQPAAPPPPPPQPQPEATERESESASPGPATGAEQRLSDTLHGFPAVEREPQSGATAAALASLLVRSGELKGQRLSIKVPVANIGRGEYNDVVLADPSVSTMHAKLQRREAIWILTDLGSTNGTFVEGERLTGEVPLGPGTTLRFGDVSALFEPLDESAPVQRPGATRLMERVEPGVKAPVVGASVPAAEAAPDAAPQPAPRRPRRPIHKAPSRPQSPSTLTVVGLLILIAILAYLLSSF